jgi:hypothetical protein
MKLLIAIVYPLLICTSHSFAQTDTITHPNEENLKYMYNPETNTSNLSYDYSNKWDLDGDGQKDSLFFIGNGGAHTYFFLRIVLSNDNKLRDFSSIKIDMPIISDQNLPKESGKNSAVQFIPGDFDNNGTVDLYINFNNSFSRIPKEWKKKGIVSKYVIISFNAKSLKVRNP